MQRHDRNDLPPEVDDAFDVLRRTRNLRDLDHPHKVRHLLDINAQSRTADLEGHDLHAVDEPAFQLWSLRLFGHRDCVHGLRL